MTAAGNQKHEFHIWKTFFWRHLVSQALQVILHLLIIHHLLTNLGTCIFNNIFNLK